jgi:replication-associated recombination protein RarA
VVAVCAGRRRVFRVATLSKDGWASHVILLAPPGVGKTHIAVFLAETFDPARLLYPLSPGQAPLALVQATTPRDPYQATVIAKRL